MAGPSRRCFGSRKPPEQHGTRGALLPASDGTRPPDPNQHVSAGEVVRTVLARIAALEPQINAFATLTDESALIAADAADRRLASGDEVGVLHGIPVTIKDLTQTKGVRTEYGSHLRKGFVPEQDAPLVTRLKQAGAIYWGKPPPRSLAGPG